MRRRFSCFITPVLAVERCSEKSFAPLEILDLCVYFILRLFVLFECFFKTLNFWFFPTGGLFCSSYFCTDMTLSIFLGDSL